MDCSAGQLWISCEMRATNNSWSCIALHRLFVCLETIHLASPSAAQHLHNISMGLAVEPSTLSAGPHAGCRDAMQKTSRSFRGPPPVPRGPVLSWFLVWDLRVCFVYLSMLYYCCIGISQQTSWGAQYEVLELTRSAWSFWGAQCAQMCSVCLTFSFPCQSQPDSGRLQSFSPRLCS